MHTSLRGWQYRYCERFEPRSHFKRLSLIVRVNVINNQSIMPSTDVIQLTLTLKMTTAQVVETSVTVNNNSPIQDYVHPDDQTQPFNIDIAILIKGIKIQRLINQHMIKHCI